VETILNKLEFQRLLYDTLEKWNMNQRGAKLKAFEFFSRSLLNLVPEIRDLHKYRVPLGVDGLTNKMRASLKKMFLTLDVMESKRRIVGVSKILHFLIPDLIMPIDGKYTMTCFYGYNKFSDDPEKEFDDFLDIFLKINTIAKQLNLSSNDIGNDVWNISVSKLIDNSIIGFNWAIKSYVIQYGDDTVGRLMELLQAQACLSSVEKKQYERLIQVQKDKIQTSEKEKIREMLLIKKAHEAGITVSEEEIDEEIARKNILRKENSIRRET